MLVTIQTRRGNLLQVPEYRFESCPDYKDIYLRIVLAIRNSTERVTPSERSP
jgi:hypothetical protein